MCFNDKEYHVKKEKGLKSPCISCIFGPRQTRCMNLDGIRPCKPIDICVNMVVDDEPIYFVEVTEQNTLLTSQK